MNALKALLMALVVTHTTPADGSFSAAGSAAWNEEHTIVGLVTAAGSAAWPIGSIYMSSRSTSPGTILGFGTWLALEGQFLAGVKAGDAEFDQGVSGGATGVSAAGAIDMTLYIPKGTNAAVSYTPSGTVSFPATAPSFQGTAVTASASVNWPVGQPVFTGVTSSAHQHALPIFSTGATGFSFMATSHYGVLVTTTGASGFVRVSATATGPVVRTSTTAGTGAPALSQTAGSTIPAGTVAWPASVPQAVLSLSAAGIISWPTAEPDFTGIAKDVNAQTFSGTVGSGTAIFSGTARGILPPYRTVYMWERTA